MKRTKALIYAAWIALSEGVGILAGLLTRRGIEAYGQLNKPALTPPAAVFPVVWTVLYALMGISAARIWLSPEGSSRNRGLGLFVIQLVVNFFWSLFFFNLQAFGLSLLWLLGLWVLIVLMILQFRKVDPVAAWLQLPYLLWVSFAAVLNYLVWRMN